MNPTITFIVGLLLGVAAGAVFYLVRARKFTEERECALSEKQSEFDRRIAEKEAEFDRKSLDLQTVFRGISAEVLRENREEFLKQATPALSEKLNPIAEALKRYETAIRELEGRRENAYGSIEKMLGVVAEGQKKLTYETGSLVNALKSPSARGKWGEITLRRVVEITGMSGHCAFVEQSTVDGPDGKLRPDLVVNMPAGRSVVIDAKAPLDAYMLAMEATDESARARHLADHAQAVREHMKKLALKAYWAQFESTPEFVVLFLPGESFFAAALEKDRSLIEDGIASGVVLATPTTLIALMRVVEMGWNQVKLAENAQKISDAGKDLFDRFATFAGHVSGLGSGIQKAVESYNKAIRSWETRVVPSAKRFSELGAVNSGTEIVELSEIEAQPRPIEVVIPADAACPANGGGIQEKIS